MPSYSEFLDDVVTELQSTKGNSITGVIEGEYFKFYGDVYQLSQFKLSLYDQLLKYNTYEYVKNYFVDYILSFIGGGGTGEGGNPVLPVYKIQNKIIIG